MGKCKTEEETTKAYADLSECEKYMWTMKRVGNAGNKIDCMLFKAQFRTRVEELVASMRVIEKACDEVKTSESLHKVLATILTLVNTINTGGEGQGKGVAQGFNLDALLKLNEVSTNHRLNRRILLHLTRLLSTVVFRPKPLTRRPVFCSISSSWYVTTTKLCLAFTKR